PSRVLSQRDELTPLAPCGIFSPGSPGESLRNGVGRSLNRPLFRLGDLLCGSCAHLFCITTTADYGRIGSSPSGNTFDITARYAARHWPGVQELRNADYLDIMRAATSSATHRSPSKHAAVIAGCILSAHTLMGVQGLVCWLAGGDDAWPAHRRRQT